MKNQLIVIGTVVLLLVVGLSGCNEIFGADNEVTGDTGKVELVSHSTYSAKIKNYYPEKSYTKICDGFNRDAEGVQYLVVGGTVKNIAGYMLNNIKITARFYDANDNYLNAEHTTISNLANSYTADFDIGYWVGTDYYENVDNVKLEITAS
jgi:hypothetical protein